MGAAARGCIGDSRKEARAGGGGLGAATGGSAAEGCISDSGKEEPRTRREVGLRASAGQQAVRQVGRRQREVGRTEGARCLLVRVRA